MNWMGQQDSFDPGDEDDGAKKRYRRGVRVNDRVRWRILSDDGKQIIQTLTGMVVAIMSPTAVDANDVWIRWDGQARPQIFNRRLTDRFEVL